MIRPVAEDDFIAIASITNHYITTSAIHFAYEPVTAEQLMAMWQSHDNHPWFVVGDRQGVVGYAKSGVWRERQAYSWTAEVGLYLAPHACGRGLGTARNDPFIGGKLRRRNERSGEAPPLHRFALFGRCYRRHFDGMSRVTGVALFEDISLRSTSIAARRSATSCGNGVPT